MGELYFNKFKNKYIIEGIIVAKTGIHIGGGDSDETFEPMVVGNIVVKDIERNPYIPGSSIKGVIRSYLERVLATLECPDELSGLKACTVNNPCLEQRKESEEYKNAKDKGGEVFAKYIAENTCTVCKIFGSGENSSKVMFRDMKVVKDSFYGFEYRTGVAIERDVNIAAEGALYEIQVVPSSTKFQFYMTADNLSDKEWEYLLLAIASLKNGDMEIGGMKSRGLGQIELICDENAIDKAKYSKITAENLKQSIINPESVEKIDLNSEIKRLLNQGSEVN